jgi:cytochrome b561
MTVGVTIIVLLIVRFILRVRTKRPVEATTGNKVFDSLSKFVHYGLYVMVLAVTVLGLVFSLQTGRFQSAFLGAESQFTPPPNGFPQIQGTPGVGPFTPPEDGTGAFPEGGPVPGFQGGPGGPGRVFGLLMIHELAAYALLVLVALHILAALYHQFVLRDHPIARMWYGAVE